MYPDSNMQNYYNHVKCKIGNALRIMTGMEKISRQKQYFTELVSTHCLLLYILFLCKKLHQISKLERKKIGFVLPSLIHYSKTYLGH